MSDTTVLADIIPCEVLLPDGRLIRRGRAWVTERGVIVYSENQAHSPVKEFASRHTAPPSIDDPRKTRRRQVHRATTEAGDVVINPTLGCLCGFPALRHYTLENIRRDAALRELV